MNNLINIQDRNGQLIVSSREVAENFEKEHKHVMESIRELETSVENSAHLFIPSKYRDSYKREQSEYLLTRDGFTLLAMGFTGRKALEWKLKYIEAFNKMENALKEVYHISQTAIVNNIMEALEDKLINTIDKRLSVYEENYRPTHANKIDLNNYIKNSLGDDREVGEVNLVKQRVLLMLDADAWQDIPYKKLTDNIRLIDESIRAIKSFRTKLQLSLFEN
ncbi:Rha family transcriptional regulator [Tissierella praeacuta]|uniref:Rha family transcriptional regulator n=1 Tax=Tissierella praeacuta TaxID=43131 RepID=UPI002FD9B69F